MTKEIGLFCGTFNPIHIGHLLIAEFARQQFGLEKVIFITSGNPPHRNEGLLDKYQRHELVSLAIKENNNFEISDFEVKQDKPSYTINTVKHFQALYPQHHINLIIGADNIAHLKEWYQYEELFTACRFLAAPRKASNQHQSTTELVRTLLQTINIGYIEAPEINICASEIRQRIADGKTVLYMVPPAVNEAIVKKKLYHSKERVI